MHCTGVGKAILAYLPSTITEDILKRKGLPFHTQYTITDREKFLSELEEVKQRGYALDLQENEVGITCIAVPIFDHAGNAVAALSVSAPTIRMTDERIEELKPHVLKTGSNISYRLGYR
jgi:DNA-binding IclR family transcriptional regulator